MSERRIMRNVLCRSQGNPRDEEENKITRVYTWNEIEANRKI